MMVSFVLSFFPRDVLDEILNLIGSVSEGFSSYSYLLHLAHILQDDYIGIIEKQVKLFHIIREKIKVFLTVHHTESSIIACKTSSVFSSSAVQVL